MYTSTFPNRRHQIAGDVVDLHEDSTACVIARVPTLVSGEPVDCYGDLDMNPRHH